MWANNRFAVIRRRPVAGERARIGPMENRMSYRLAADALVWLHLGFILFVLCGGLLLLRWPRLAWLHLPAVVWGCAVEFLGLPCPLTPWENRLRHAAGDAGYDGVSSSTTCCR
ncbi:Protein of Uncharacterised function (DUF2784) [Pseudomonas aeruginosa]|nr:Protein of Uncharacterised function (DUF2784) [Pseudomonas aeruginosa]